MKLLYCTICNDVFSLGLKVKTCTCGQTSGKYEDEVNATYSGPGITLGFTNLSFLAAIQNQPKDGLGPEFVAFVIPKNCKTFKKINNG